MLRESGVVLGGTEMFGDYEFWVELIGYASIVSVAIFGLIGALSKEWDRRKEKAAAAKAQTQTAEAEGSTAGKASSFSWSYVAAIGIILSAVFAMTSNILQDWIDTEKQAEAAEKALADRQEQDRRFNAQIGHLASLNDQMRTANDASRSLMDGMGRSLQSQRRLLTAQDMLLTNARRAMLMTAGLTRQERENTTRVLRSVWDEANRISGGRVELLVTTTCGLEGEQSTPLLFANGVAVVTLLDESEANEDERGELEGWNAVATLGRSLYSFRQDSITASIEELQTLTRFHSFLAFLPDEISSPDQWRAGYLKIMLISRSPSIPGFDALVAAGTPVSERQGAGIPGRQQLRLPCEVNTTVFANGRMVGGGEAPVILVRDSNGEVSLVVETEAERVEEDSLPTFGGEAGD